MKTIPVCLIIAGIFGPAVTIAEPEQRGPREGNLGGRAKGGGQRHFAEAWKAADSNEDGVISWEEFSEMRRVSQLPEDKRRMLFDRLDKNGDGGLDRHELNRMARQGGPRPGKWLWELDTDRSGGVSFEEFKNGRMLAKLPAERVEKMFKKLDTNGDGVISPKDRPKRPDKRGKGKKGEEQSEAGRMRNRKQVFGKLDADGDRKISFEEFQDAREVRGLDEDAQEDRFEALDQDDDKVLDPDEFPPPMQREANGKKRGKGPKPRASE